MRKIITLLLTNTLLLVFATVNLAHSNNYSYGPTTDNDRLWQIAIKTRPNTDITPQQMMMALFERNPTAFADNNINGLYSGVNLRVPYVDEINLVQPHAAIITVAKHNRDWYQAPTHLPPPKANLSTAHISALLNQKLVSMENEISLLAGQLQQFVVQAQQQQQESTDSQAVLHNQLVAMAQSVQSLADQLEIEKTAINALNKNAYGAQSLWQQDFQNYIIFGLAALGFVLLLFVITWAKFLTMRRELITARQTQSQSPHTTIDTSEDEEELEDEYDFINSKEGIPAKLDLARAYIDMDERDTAQEMLEDILRNGDKTQQQTAKHLMSHIAMPG